MKVSKAGLEIIKAHEGLRLTAYRCPAGVWTIGYGITSGAGVGKVAQGMKITQAEAEEMLKSALAIYEQGVIKAIKRQPTQAQFDAMLSLAYNIGVGAFSRSSVVRHFNAGDIQKAADAFRLWNKGGGKVLPGLVRRRKEERDLFLSASAPAKPAEPLPPPPPPAPVQPPEPAPAPPVAQPDPAPKIGAWIATAAAALIAAFAAWIMKG
jgi:lysozyme